MINSSGELLNLHNPNSLIRVFFKDEIDLIDFNLSPLKIPKGFKDLSLTPKKNFNLVNICELLERDLLRSGAGLKYIKETLPGICEVIKNAYEHGNLKDNSKRIIIKRHFSKKEVEYIIGDNGGKIDGNLFPYLLLFRKNESNSLIDLIPDFYSFRGDSYSPLEHSGVGTKVMNKCFENIEYFKNQGKGLLVYLSKKSFK